MKNIDSVALFGTHCICLTNAHRSNRYEACNRILMISRLILTLVILHPDIWIKFKTFIIFILTIW